MRAIILASLVLVVTIYVAVALYIHRQQKWAVAPNSIDIISNPDVMHPEAALSAIRRAFTSGDYSDAIRPLLERSLNMVPSSYQSSLLHTVYRANRLEEPGLVRKGFETALRRFPANGRLHLTYARWLLTSGDDVGPDGRDLAVEHLRKAMFLEEGLVGPSLTLLDWGGVPAKEWIELTPETLPARRQLLHSLFGSGYRAEALAMLEQIVGAETDADLLRQASLWALQWREPRLALDAARRWREQELAVGNAGLQLARASLLVARAYLALGDADSAHDVVRESLELMDQQPGASRPARLELLNGMGYEYLRVGRSAAARSHFLKARAHAPYQAASSLGLARAYRRDGDNKTAIEHYRRVLELERRNTEAEKELQELLATEH
jgi:Tfp pilus assembly protein PilF